MRPPLAGLLFVALVTLSLAPRASALPDFVASDPPPGWSYGALPRSSGDATGGSCVIQSPALPGESANTWFNGSMHNIGDIAAAAYTGLYLDDVLRTLQGPFNVGPLAYARYVNIQSSLILKGGRHTLLSRADVLGNVAELNESNNDWAKGFIWSPLVLTPGGPVTRTYDPPAYTTLTGPWPNCEGFSGTAEYGPYWYAFAVLGDQAGSDYDVTLHTAPPLNNPESGFGSFTARSHTTSDHIDFVTVNTRHAARGTYYAGVQNFAGTGNKVVQFEQATPITISGQGVYGPFSMLSGDIVNVHEIYGFTGLDLQIEIVPLSGNANLGACLIGPSASGQSSMYDYVGGGLADSAPAGSSEIMRVNLTQFDYHGLVVFKHDSSDLEKSVIYKVIVSYSPNLVTNRTPSGWSGPIVPRNDAAGPPFTLPPTLNGNQPTTSVNFNVYNNGPGSVVDTFINYLFVDDVASWYGIVGQLFNGNYALFTNSVGSTVRGGRHHLRCDADGDNAINEVEWYETDNSFTDWFVWTPLDLADQAPVPRDPPPVLHPQGWGPYESSDGFRIYRNFITYWSAVGMIPTGMASDYDVRLHTASSGSKDGFGDWLAWSASVFPGEPDFCIVNYNVAPSVPRDVSVTNWSWTGDTFYIERADAPYYGEVPAGVSTYGVMTLAPHACLNIHEFYLTAGVPWNIAVQNLDGGADLELSLFDGTTAAFHTKQTYTAHANSYGAGESEQVGPVTVSASGFYAVVVSKSKATDENKTSHYQIVFSSQGTVDAPPTSVALPVEFALSMPRPNPTAAGTSFELAIPQGRGSATVSVYDLAGRLVQTLARGEVTPGRHVLTWDGRDRSGALAAPGVYLAKLEAPHVTAMRKITLLR
jgi:hypothetical protein